MVIWQDVTVRIRHKIWHVHGVKGRLHRDFTLDYGDIPLWRFNEITNKREICVNTRGRAYGARKRQMYRTKKNKNRDQF